MTRPARQRTWGAARAALVASAIVAVVSASASAADDHPELPPGPIRDRHDLMEGVGKNAKAIGAALKAGKPADMEKPATDIAAVMDRFITLFPAGSEGQGSRAKPAVWSDRKKFDALSMQLKAEAEAVAAAAKGNGDVKTTTAAMWKTCKGCHTDFREPMEGE